jgi:hypothetical protein
MTLYDVGRRLWQERLAAIVCAVLAIVVAILATFHISFAPPALKPRALQMGTAGTSLLIDSHHSSLGTVNSKSSRLVTLASDYTELANTEPIIAPVTRALGVGPAAVGVQVQVTSQVPLSQQQPLEPQVGTEILATRRRYYLVARNDAGSQTMAFFAQAPTGRQAILMVKTATNALRHLIATEARQAKVPARERVVVRTIGRISGGTLDSHVSEEAAVLIAVLAWALAMTAFLGIKDQARRSALRPTSPELTGA